jgi:hypothetical protein
VKTALAILALLCVAMVPPVPAIKRPHKSAAVHQGAGSAKLIAKALVPAPPTTNTFTWKYPPGIMAANWFWNVEASSDLANWITVISNASGPGEVRVKRTDPPGFFRLEGRPSP